MKNEKIVYAQIRAQYEALFDMFDKVGIPPETRWRSLVLYLRNMKDYPHLSDAQKATVQELLTETIEKRDFSTERLTVILEGYRMAIVHPYLQKVEVLLSEATGLVSSFQRILQSRTGDIFELENEAVNIITGETSASDPVEKLRSAFSKVRTLLENDLNSLERLATEDGLTAIPNRRAYDAFMHKAIERWQTEGRPLSLALFDIDHFKRFNDEHGHRIGDQALIVVAKHIAAAARKINTNNDVIAARYGGEEFVLAISGPDATSIGTYVEKCRSAVRSFNFLIRDSSGNVVETGLHLTMSAGVAYMWKGWTGALLENLVDGADKALYFSKESGRDKGALFTPGDKFEFTLLTSNP